MTLNDILQSAQGGQALDNLAARFGLSDSEMKAATQALIPAFSEAFQKLSTRPDIFALTGSVGPIIGQNYGARLMPRVTRHRHPRSDADLRPGLRRLRRGRGDGRLAPLLLPCRLAGRGAGPRHGGPAESRGRATRLRTDHGDRCCRSPVRCWSAVSPMRWRRTAIPGRSASSLRRPARPAALGRRPDRGAVSWAPSWGRCSAARTSRALLRPRR